MSRAELIRRAQIMNEEIENGADKEEALEEAGLVSISPADESAAQTKHEELKAKASGKKATLDDDGNLQREPTDAHRELWEDDE